MLVVGFARLGAGELEQVDQLIEADEEAAVVGEAHEACEQLQLVIDAGVGDDRSHAECLAGVGFGCVFAAQPANRGSLQLLIGGFVATAVGRDHGGKVIATDHLGQLLQTLADHGLAGYAALFGVADRSSDEALDDARQRSPLWLRAGG